MSEIKQVAIIGLGLMGSSLGLAMKKHKPDLTRCGYTRSEVGRQAALDRGIIDLVFESPEAAVEHADLTVICLPVHLIPDIVKQCAGAFKPGSIVTDVGSSKEEIMMHCEPLLKGIRDVIFIGSHPVCGSDQQGLDAADENLYDGAAVIVTPHGDTPREKELLVEGFWQEMGAHITNMSPEEHDRLLAQTSHMVHLLSAITAQTAGRGDKEHARAGCGTGFKDMTRLAEGSPELWVDIVRSNREFIKEELGNVITLSKELAQILDAADDESLLKFLEKSKRAREEVLRRESDK